MFYQPVHLFDLSIPIEEALEGDTYPLDAKLGDLKEASFCTRILLADTEGLPIRMVPHERLAAALHEQWKWQLEVNKAILHAVDEAIAIVDTDGKVSAWNARAESLYETSAEEILGSSLTDYFSKDSIVLISSLEEKKKITGQYNQPKPGVHVLINTIPIMLDGNLVGGVSAERDITEMVKLSDELTHTTAYIHDLESRMGLQHIDDPFHKIKGRSKALHASVEIARKVAPTDAAVMVTGESGVGKELFAQAIHKAGTRTDGPFIAINCGAIPVSLFESELFGYEKGAFTGADKEGKYGKIELANGGTLFLDEIGELPLALQVKLLRVLQEKQYYRVGGTQPVKVDARIISATNRNLEQMVAEGRFREDLYYRLNVVSVDIPPLRERLEDIPELVQLFLKEYSLIYRKPVPSIDTEVMLSLMNLPWSGNIRQLRNVIERMMILSDEQTLSLQHLPDDLSSRKKLPLRHAGQESTSQTAGLKATDILEALKKTYGNKTAAARLLGISRVTLYKKMIQLRISD